MNERTIFMSALEIEDQQSRSAYLDQACQGQAEIRERVEKLLNALTCAGNFLDKPAFDEYPLTGELPPRTFEASPFEIQEAIGSIVGGKYVLRQILGVGGMGSVYL